MDCLFEAHNLYFFVFRNFMNKHQKPVLTGQRFKTRKRGKLCCVCVCMAAARRAGRWGLLFKVLINI